ncbi:MAG: AAA family ATPase, partial [Leptolyngbyaceae cyanobacterium SL_7_1]|nr:AAA family ATPase [Leptolyngbyaceae cyanobacterium SL_7_1]
VYSVLFVAAMYFGSRIIRRGPNFNLPVPGIEENPAVETTPAENGTIHISLAVAEESIQQRAVLYDKEGDAHFDTISAFIKSVRGSDPDAALFWLARMVYAGEDPRFIFRRMVILASEDVGLADPNAIVVVHACAEAFDRVGMPEGRYPLAHAALYLATCAKSNSVMGFFDALSAVEQEREEDVPLHLRDANRDKHGFGHGKGYLYPHSYREHWVEQQYLPSSLQGQVFYQPSDRGYENQIRHQVMRQREAQLAALVEGVGVALPETLTFSPTDSTTDRWLQRTLGEVGERLAGVRDRLFALAPPQRHHLVLDLNAGSGLLTWEALRQVPEGGVYACVRAAKDAQALEEQAAVLEELVRPVVIESPLAELPDRLQVIAPRTQFDRIVGRNVLSTDLAQLSVLKQLIPWLSPNGVLLLVEAIPAETQRLAQLLGDQEWERSLHEKFTTAEETIYKSSFNLSSKPALWNTEALQMALDNLGLTATIQVEPTVTTLQITPALIDRWFTSGGDRPSYADHLTTSLSSDELATVRSIVTQRLAHQVVEWRGAIAFIILKAQ